MKQRALKVLVFLCTTYYLGVFIVFANLPGALYPSFGSELMRLLSCSAMAMGFFSLYKTYQYRRESREEVKQALAMMHKHSEFIQAAIEEAKGDPEKISKILEANGWIKVGGSPVDESTPDKP